MIKMVIIQKNMDGFSSYSQKLLKHFLQLIAKQHQISCGDNFH